MIVSTERDHQQKEAIVSPTRRTKQGLLAQVFPGTSQRMMHAWIAQVCVLFEDLNLEVNGFYNKTLPEEAHARLEYSQLYFLRRAIGTLREFQTGITTLDRDADFQVVKKRFKSESSREWDDAVRYFEGNKLKQWLSSIRNDVGGHFGGIGVCTSLPTTPHLVVGRSACRVGVGPSLNRSWAQRSRPVVQAGRRAFPGDESVVD